MENEKINGQFKATMWFSIILIVLATIIFIGTISQTTYSTIILASYIFQLLLLVATAVGCGMKKKFGLICGIIVGILMILSLSIADMAIGICFIINCAGILKKSK